MYSMYAECDPITSGVITKPDQILPYYVMDVSAGIPGLPGLFIAGIFCASLRYSLLIQMHNKIIDFD